MRIEKLPDWKLPGRGWVRRNSSPRWKRVTSSGIASSRINAAKTTRNVGVVIDNLQTTYAKCQAGLYNTGMWQWLLTHYHRHVVWRRDRRCWSMRSFHVAWTIAQLTFLRHLVDW